MMNPLDVVIAPTRLYRSLRERPSWVITFAALTLVSILVEWFSFGPALESTIARLLERATPEMIQDAIQHIEERRVVNAAIVPLKLGVPMAIFSFVLYLVCSVSKPVSLPHWRHFLAIVVWSGWIPALGRIIALVMRLTVGTLNPESGSALPQPLGLSLIRLSSKEPGLLYILDGLNVFTLWYLLLLSLGISIFCGFTRVKGMTIAGGVWGLGLLVSAALLRLSVLGVQ